MSYQEDPIMDRELRERIRNLIEMRLAEGDLGRGMDYDEEMDYDEGMGYAVGGRKKYKKKAGYGSKAGAAKNPWIAHVKNYMADNDVTYKQALRMAGETYKKGSGRYPASRGKRAGSYGAEQIKAGIYMGGRRKKASPKVRLKRYLKKYIREHGIDSLMEIMGKLY